MICRKRFYSSRGFTLVELLVVISIIGVLVALLLPAVQAAREAARRIQCTNNIRQLGIGILNYESSQKTLPPGGITDGPCCGTKSGASWAIFVLPYIELQNLYDQYDFDEPNESNTDSDGDGLTNAVVRESNPVAFDCPSDEDTDLNDYPASGPGRKLLYNRGSYRGNTGLCTVESEAFWDSSSQQNERFKHQRGPLPGMGTLPSGRWSITKPTRLAQIIDGTSHTMLLGEKSHLGVSDEAKRRRTFWAYTYTSYNSSLTFLQSRSIINDYDRCLSIDGDFRDNPCKRSWGSLHVSGFNIVLCDGSVQFISDTVDIFLFGEMSTIAGGEITNLN